MPVGTKRFETLEVYITDDSFNMKQWQTGGALPVFVGARMQRGFGRFWTQSGNGLGGILRKLFRSAVPFLICGGKAVGRQALKTGVAIGEDVLSGKKRENGLHKSFTRSSWEYDRKSD